MVIRSICIQNILFFFFDFIIFIVIIYAVVTIQKTKLKSWSSLSTSEFRILSDFSPTSFH